MTVRISFSHGAPGFEIDAPRGWPGVPRVGDWIDLSPNSDQGDEQHGYVRRVYWCANSVVLICGDTP